MTAYSEFVPDIAAQLPGCPTITINRIVKKVCKDFFHRSEAWRVDFDASSTGTKVVVLITGMPVETRVKRITEMRYLDNPPMTSKTPVQMNRLYPDDTYAGTPKYYTMTEEDEIFALPVIEGSAIVYEGRAVVVPTLDCTALDDNMYDEYEHAITQGVLGLLMEMPQQDWTNVKLGMVKTARYAEEVEKARLQVANRNSIARVSHTGAYGGLLDGV
jgi:hypothetical protein